MVFINTYPPLSGALSGSSTGTSAIAVGGFRISGNRDMTGLACCLYVWDAPLGIWMPMTQP